MLASSLSLYLLNFDEKVIYDTLIQHNFCSFTHKYSITMIWPFMNISEAVAFIINIAGRKEARSFFIQVMDMCGGNREDGGIINNM